jgi:hypothetical protein
MQLACNLVYKSGVRAWSDGVNKYTCINAVSFHICGFAFLPQYIIFSHLMSLLTCMLTPCTLFHVLGYGFLPQTMPQYNISIVTKNNVYVQLISGNWEKCVLWNCLLPLNPTTLHTVTQTSLCALPYNCDPTQPVFNTELCQQPINLGQLDSSNQSTELCLYMTH